MQASRDQSPTDQYEKHRPPNPLLNKTVTGSPPLIDQINDIDVRFTVFNNERSLSLPSAIRSKRFGKAAAVLDPKRPQDGYYNRVIGFGRDGLEHIDNIIDWYRTNGCSCFFSLSPTEHNDEVLNEFRTRHIEYCGQDCVLIAPSGGAPPKILPEMEIETVAPNGVETLFDLMRRNGWPVDEDLCLRNRQHYTRPDFLFYLLRVDGQPAAMASMFIKDNFAWLSNDATLPEFGGMGCQRFLIEERLRVAAGIGVDIVLSDTDYLSTSFRNYLRTGFQIAYMTAEFTVDPMKS